MLNILAEVYNSEDIFINDSEIEIMEYDINDGYDSICIKVTNSGGGPIKGLGGVDSFKLQISQDDLPFLIGFLKTALKESRRRLNEK